MKTLTSRIIATASLWLLAMSVPATAFELPDALLDIIAVVESNCNDRAVGDGGKARGRYQIWACYVADVNRIAGTSYTHSDAHDPDKARKMVEIYLTHYGEIYQRRTRRSPSVEVLCRIHNGGPSGWRKESTLPYWGRCQEAMKNHNARKQEGEP